jgi:hypothetical protein
VLLVFGVFFGSGIAVAAFTVAGHTTGGTINSWSQAVPASIDQVATTVLCVLVPILMVRRRGLTRADLGLVKPPPPPGPTGIRMAAWALLGLIVGGIVTSSLLTGHYVSGRLTNPDLVTQLFHAAQAGFIEEVVVLGFVVTTLEQARRPFAEIVVVALLLRASYHIYYGPGVVGIFVWASIFLWLFLRFRSILPLIVVHSAWDILSFLDQRWHAVGGFEVLVWVILFFTAIVLWLVGRQTRGLPGAAAPMPPMVHPPGWYPDPWRVGEERWFDGWVWHPATRMRPPAPPMPPAPPPVSSPWPPPAPPVAPPGGGEGGWPPTGW